MKTISVLGCGWLGLPVALHLKELGFTVRGSTTTSSKLDTLKQSGILGSLVDFHPDPSGDDVKEFFDSDVLFLNIPFKRKLPDPTYYLKQIRSVIKEAESSSIDFVIFASSTSIYPEKKGVAIEDHPLLVDHPRAKVLKEIEDTLMRNDRFSTTVLRFAGLYGGQRKIGRFLSGRTDVDNADSPVNLVHLDDCVQIVAQIIQQDIRGETFNVCSDHHPTRRELYTKAAENLQLSAPEFNENKPAKFKVVSNEKLKKHLQYQFVHPDPLKM